MTSVGATEASGLPVVNQALEPASVRDGSAATKKAYESALAFEQTLVEQLAKSMTATSGLEESGLEGESGEESSSAVGGEISSLMPQALTSGIMGDGGLGLAAQLTRDFESQASTTVQSDGGTQS